MAVGSTGGRTGLPVDALAKTGGRGGKGLRANEGPVSPSPKHRASGSARGVWRVGSYREMGCIVKFTGTVTKCEISNLAFLGKENPQEIY